MHKLVLSFGVSLSSIASVWANAYEWSGEDGSRTFGDVTVTKADGEATLKGSNAAWTPSSADPLTGVTLISATTLSSLIVQDGVDFKANAGTLDQGDGALPATVSVSHARATIVASGGHPINATTAFSGAAGTLAFVGDGSGGTTAGESVYQTPTDTKIKTSRDEAWEVIEKTCLADLVSVEADLYSGSTLPDCGCYFLRNDGQTASVQVQAPVGAWAANDSVMGALVDFKQVGADIYFRQRGWAGYYSREKNPGYENPGSYEMRITESKYNNRYYPIDDYHSSPHDSWVVANLKLVFSSQIGSYQLIPSIALGGTSALDSESGMQAEFGDVQGRPVDVTLAANNALASVKKSIVHSNATLFIKGQMGSAMGDYYLMPGAKVVVQSPFSVGNWHDLDVSDGAVWDMTGQTSYISNLRFHGAGTVKGLFCPGYGYNSTVSVDGETGPAIYDGDFRVYTTYGHNLKFDVGDVTSSPDADLIVLGRLMPLTTGDTDDLYWRKTGAGTLRLCGAIMATRYPFWLESGTVELGSNGVSTAETDWVSKGFSTLTACAATTNAVRTLALESDLSLIVKADASLAIATLTDWSSAAPDAQFEITLEEGATLRIGTSAAGIPAAVRRKVHVNDRPCRIDADGYVTAKPKEGLSIILR